MPSNYVFTILTTLAGGLSCGMIGFGICKLVLVSKDRRDKRIVYRYMQNQIPEANKWLATSDIANNTNLSYSKVEDICSSHPKIIAVTGMGSLVWGLLDISEQQSLADQSAVK